MKKQPALKPEPAPTPQPAPPRYCVTCLHVQRWDPSMGTTRPTDQWRCAHPSGAFQDHVTGVWGMLYCGVNRNTPNPNRCGPDGKYWELRTEGE